MIKSIIEQGVILVLDVIEKSHQKYLLGIDRGIRKKVFVKNVDLSLRPKHKLWSGISMEI